MRLLVEFFVYKSILHASTHHSFVHLIGFVFADSGLSANTNLAAGLEHGG